MERLDRQLRYFMRIADLSSLSRAANSLELTQSGLSRQLAALEVQVGKPLFLRTGRGVELTNAGKVLLEAARVGYALVDGALDTVREKEGITQGNVRLATVHTLNYYFSASVISIFANAHPQVVVSQMARSSPEVVELVECGKADIGFVYDAAVASPHIRSVTLFEDEMCLIAKTCAAVPDQIDLTSAPLKLVAFPPHYALRRMLKTGDLCVHFAAEAETIDVMLRLVSAGVGYCILPLRMPDSVIQESGLKKVRINKPILRRRVVAIIRADRHPVSFVRDLLDTAVQVAA